MYQTELRRGVGVGVGVAGRCLVTLKLANVIIG